MKFLLSLFCLYLSVSPGFTASKSLNMQDNSFIEYQNTQVKNQTDAIDNGDSWRRERLESLYGQVGFQLALWGHHIESSAYFRQSRSPILEKDETALNNILYPNKIINRDFFKLHHYNTTGDSQSEFVLNQFSYEWGDDEFSFEVGRLNIGFGNGYFSNPINPFVRTIAFSPQFGQSQANDGMIFSIDKNSDMKIFIYLLADKSLTDYDEKITRTAMIRGLWRYNSSISLGYILGEDQKKHKYGLELNKVISDKRKGYIQLVKHSQSLDEQSPSAKGTNHYVAGYQVLHSQTRYTIELGKSDRDPLNRNYYSYNYFPAEAFTGLVIQRLHSDKCNTELGIFQDTDSNFRYVKISSTYKTNKSLGLRIFYHSSVGTTEADSEFDAQRQVPQVLGAALRSNF